MGPEHPADLRYLLRAAVPGLLGAQFGGMGPGGALTVPHTVCHAVQNVLHCGMMKPTAALYLRRSACTRIYTDGNDSLLSCPTGIPSSVVPVSFPVRKSFLLTSKHSNFALKMIAPFAARCLDLPAHNYPATALAVHGSTPGRHDRDHRAAVAAGDRAADGGGRHCGQEPAGDLCGALPHQQVPSGGAEGGMGAKG